MGEAARVTDLSTSFYVQHSLIGVNWIGQEKRGPKQQDMVESAINEAIDQLVPAVELQRIRWYTNLLGRVAELGPIDGNDYYWDFPYQEEGEPDLAWARRYQEWNRLGPLPFVWQVLPAESTFPPSFGALKDEVLSTVTMSWRELADIFSTKEIGGVGGEEAKQWDTVTLGIYANRNYLAYCAIQGGDKKKYGPVTVTTPVRDKVLRVVEHNLGRCPIRINAGMTTALQVPGKHWKSVLFHIRDLCLQLDRRASEAATASKYGALPMFKMRLQDIGIDSEGSGSDVREYLEGDVVELRARMGDQGEEDIEPLFQPQFGVQTLQQIEMVAARAAQLSGATEGLEGGLGPAGQAAWARSFIVDLARSHFSELTNAVTAGDIDRVEMLERAVAAWGQKIPINPRGTPKANIYLEPDELRDWSPYLKAEFKLRVAQNDRADLDLMVSILERRKQSGLAISPAWIMQKLGNIEQPYQMLEESEVWDLIESDEVKAWRRKRLMEKADIVLGEDVSMPLSQAQQYLAQLPPQVAAALMNTAVQPPGQNGGGGGGRRLMGDTMGALRAGSPMSTLPTGPNPAEIAARGY